MDGDTNAEDDERSIELSSIAAIFPELVIHPDDPFSASLSLPVSPSRPVPVVFPPLVSTAPESTQQVADLLKDLSLNGTVPQPAEIRQLSHLPALTVSIQLPQGYPTSLPPKVQLSAQPDWIPEQHLRNLENNAESLWNELGHDQVIYGYIDLLQQAADNAFGLAPDINKALSLPKNLEVALLDYDLKIKRQLFDESTFDCGVCLEPKKGLVCYRLQVCGHVFCIDCLQSFYNNCITEGDVYSVKCLAPDCQQKSKSSQGNTKSLEANELLQIPLQQTQVQRYVKLLRKKRLESDKNTVYCPRQWCQGPAKQSRENNSKDTTSSPEPDDPAEKKLPPPGERLCVCEDCAFAFCCVCLNGWHGEHTPCFPRSQAELTAEEQATEAYLRKHSQICPTCRSRTQKTMGCNHMECFQCKTHFCYLCRDLLNQENPYKHFNTPYLACYMRLWEKEGGDGEPDTNGRPAEIRAIPEPEVAVAEVVVPPQAPPPPPPPPAPVPPNRARNDGQVARDGRRRGAADVLPPAQNHGLQRFLALAAADEEDGWDSDELDDL